MNRSMLKEREGDTPVSDFDIPEDTTRLVVFDHGTAAVNLDPILDSLRKDLVVLVRKVAPKQADDTLYKLTRKLGLSESLELQAGFAELHGHRRNIGRYFMSVNTRGEYQFISPHSEGASAAGMQLAAFYCYENTTDGGETILIHVDGESTAWQTLRERVIRARPASRRLTADEIARARALHGLRLPADVLKDGDRVVADVASKIPGLSLVEVLTAPIKTHSAILGRELYACWDSVGSVDHELAFAYVALLKKWGLLKEPPGGLEVPEMDTAAPRRLWRSGADYSQIFQCRITYKLEPGDLIIQNNITWTHSATNWSPGSGTRNVAAAFA